MTRASDTASSTRRAIDSRERSDVEAAATDLPTKTRSAMCCSRACLTVSTWPRRTWAENDWSATTKASAAVAPGAWPRSQEIGEQLAHAAQTWVPPTVMRSMRIVGRPTPTGHRLAVLAAGAHALVELEIVADPAHPRERLGPVADQGRALHRAVTRPSSIR